MPPRLGLLALACSVAIPLTHVAAQEAAAAKSFLTGMCESGTFVDPDSIVAEPEQPPTLPAGVIMPRFPDALHRPGYEGTVSVAFIVNADGSVRPRSVAVMESTDSVLSRWACDSVPAIRFIPARHHGRTVATQVVMPFTYRVAPDEPKPFYFEFQVEQQVRALPGSPQPHYPDELKKNRVEGQVLVQFVVDTTGRAVTNTFKVLRTSDARFSDAVRDAIGAMRFEPAKIGGHKVRQLVQQPFVFSLGAANQPPP